MILKLIQQWHKRARPQPTQKEFNVQLGCHFEEISETFDTLAFDFETAGLALDAHKALTRLADALKNGRCTVKIYDRKEFLDSIGDQVVTGIGAAYCAGMDAATATERINTSNWSKYDSNGNPIFNEFGKIAKGPSYKEPDLNGLY